MLNTQFRLVSSDLKGASHAVNVDRTIQEDQKVTTDASYLTRIDASFHDHEHATQPCIKRTQTSSENRFGTVSVLGVKHVSPLVGHDQCVAYMMAAVKADWASKWPCEWRPGGSQAVCCCLSVT